METTPPAILPDGAPSRLPETAKACNFRQPHAILYLADRGRSIQRQTLSHLEGGAMVVASRAARVRISLVIIVTTGIVGACQPQVSRKTQRKIDESRLAEEKQRADSRETLIPWEERSRAIAVISLYLIPPFCLVVIGLGARRRLRLPTRDGRLPIKHLDEALARSAAERHQAAVLRKAERSPVSIGSTPPTEGDVP